MGSVRYNTDNSVITGDNTEMELFDALQAQYRNSSLLIIRKRISVYYVFRKGDLQNTYLGQRTSISALSKFLESLS